MKYLRWIIVISVLAAMGVVIAKYIHRQEILEKIIQRLRADARAAEVLVVGVNYNEQQRKNFTTIKFLEFDADGKPLEPKYFTFPGNIIQFQSLVVRFDDKFVMSGDRLRGKSVYLFWKVFMLDGKDTKEFPITPVEEIPRGYQVTGHDGFEKEFWRRFWEYAFDKNAAGHAGIKNVQIEAPGAMFIPGYIYTIKIENSGGLRIDTAPLPAILRGEKIL